MQIKVVRLFIDAVLPISWHPDRCSVVGGWESVRGGGWGETERKQTREGGSWLQWRRKQRNPLCWQRWARQIGWLITILMHLCQQGHLVVPPPLLPPVAALRIQTEMTIAAIKKSGLPSWRQKEITVNINEEWGKKMAEAAQLAWFGLSWPVELFTSSIH